LPVRQRTCPDRYVVGDAGAGTVGWMARAVIGDGVVSLPPLSSADAEAHLAGCERAIVDSLGGGEPITEDRVR